MKKKLHDYLTSALRRDVHLTAFKAKKPPLIITSRYELLAGSVLGQDV